MNIPDLPPSGGDSIVEPEPDASPSEPTTKDAMEQLRTLFDQLVPPSKVEITDAFGTRYTVRGVLPAKAQIMVMQQLESIMDSSVSGEVLVKARSATGMVSAIVMLAGRPGVLEALAAAFAVAHPAAVKAAAERARHEGVELTDPPNAADLFPVEEIISGLAPFLVRFAKRLIGVVSAVLPTANPDAMPAANK